MLQMRERILTDKVCVRSIIEFVFYRHLVVSVFIIPGISSYAWIFHIPTSGVLGKKKSYNFKIIFDGRKLRPLASNLINAMFICFDIIHDAVWDRQPDKKIDRRAYRNGILPYSAPVQL